MESKLIMESSSGPLRLEVVGEDAQYPQYFVVYAKCRDEDEAYYAGAIVETYSKPHAVFAFRALSRLLAAVQEQAINSERACRLVDAGGMTYRCSECGAYPLSTMKMEFCYGCGARIVKEGGERA